MAAPRKLISGLILAGMAASLLTALRDLAIQTQGFHAGLAVAAALAVLAWRLVASPRPLQERLFRNRLSGGERGGVSPPIPCSSGDSRPLLSGSKSAGCHSPLAPPNGFPFSDNFERGEGGKLRPEVAYRTSVDVSLPLAGCKSTSQIVIETIPFMLGAAAVVSLSGGVPGTVGSSLCWSVLAGCAAISVGSLWKETTFGPKLLSKTPAVDALPLSSHIEESLPAPMITPRLELFADDLDVEEDEGSEEADISEEETMQTWSRVQTALEERLEGKLFVELAAGQKQCYLHIPFVPFFHSTPTGYCECDGEGEVEAELDLVQPYGARLSVRRRGDLSDPARVDIVLAITARNASTRAA